MKNFPRMFALVLFALLISLGGSIAFAQDGEETPEAEETDSPEAEPTGLVIDGSVQVGAMMQRLVEDFIEFYGDDAQLIVGDSGPIQAFEAFCNGEIDMVMATRVMNDRELNDCNVTGIEFIENILAYQGLVMLTSENFDPVVECVTISTLEQVYGIANSEITTALLDATQLEDVPLDVYVPAFGSAAYDVAESVLPGGEIRSDALEYATPQDLIDALAEAENPSIGFMTFFEFQNLEDTRDLTPLQIRNLARGECLDPSLTTFEVNTYEAYEPWMLYINLETSQDEVGAEFLEFLNGTADEPGAATLETAPEFAVTAASEINYLRNINNILFPLTGRTFSQAGSPVQITTAAEGSVNFATTGLSARLSPTLVSTFEGEYFNADVNTRFIDAEGAWALMCAGDSEVILTERPPTETELAACAEQGVELYELPLGYEALVFVTKAETADMCLTIDQLATAFAAELPEDPTDIPEEDERESVQGPDNWQDLDESFADTPLLVLLPARSSFEGDWLFTTASRETALVARSDEDPNVFYDPLGGEAIAFRSDAVANFHGSAIALMTWDDFQSSERQDDLVTLAVDAGNGCISPTETTFEDGTYPFSAFLTVTFARGAMGNGVVGAFMWNILTEENLETIEDLGLVNLNVADLRQRRDDVFALIEEAQVEALTAPEPVEEETTEDDTATEDSEEPSDDEALDDDASDDEADSDDTDAVEEDVEETDETSRDDETTSDESESEDNNNSDDATEDSEDDETSEDDN